MVPKTLFCLLCQVLAFVKCHQLSVEERLHELEEQLQIEKEQRRLLQELYMVDRRLFMRRGKSDSDNDPKSVFVRWGKAVCPGNGTELVYKGYIGGGHYVSGSGANIICLPEKPTWGKYDDLKNTHRGYIYGTEIDIDDGSSTKIFGRSVNEHDMPCAVCKSKRSVTHMFPARVDCFPGWTKEYTGYLMSNHHDRAINMEYNCIDGDPDAVPGGNTKDDENILYLVEVKCGSGSLPCQQYVNNREVACTVCSL